MYPDLCFFPVDISILGERDDRSAYIAFFFFYGAINVCLRDHILARYISSMSKRNSCFPYKGKKL